MSEPFGVRPAKDIRYEQLEKEISKFKALNSK